MFWDVRQGGLKGTHEHRKFDCSTSNGVRINIREQNWGSAGALQSPCGEGGDDPRKYAGWPAVDSQTPSIVRAKNAANWSAEIILLCRKRVSRDRKQAALHNVLTRINRAK